MSTNPIPESVLNQVQKFPYLSIFLLALALRLLLLALGFVDYWGDAQHNLIISKLTLENGFVYTDFKDRELAWLPLYRYLGSFIMLITGTYSLTILHISNTIIGALTASITSWLGMKLTNKKTGIYIGLAAVFIPYMIVFSYVNVAEMVGALLLLGWFIGLVKKNYWVALICAALGALTREEITFLIGVSFVPFLYSKNYKEIIYSVFGLILGLGIWSWWSYLNTGNLLSWLLNRFQSTTTSTAFYADEENFLIEYLLTPFSSLLQIFPLILFFIWYKKPGFEKTFDNKKWVNLLGYIVLAHWVFIFIAQFKIIAYPDPRLFVLTLPMAIIWFFSLLKQGYFRKFVSQRIIIVLIGVSLIQLVIPYYRQYSLQPRKEVGRWIQENVKDDQIIWSDQAVAIVESKRDPNFYISTDKLLPLSIRGTQEQDEWISSQIEERNIEYITSYKAPFDHTQQLWPQIETLQPFEWQGITFFPVFSYTPYKRKEGSLDALLREQFEAKLQIGSIWKLYRN
ncbi:MAG: hypothetical protein BalsKO_21690 [Balneolaceae bacterium]